MDDLDAWSNQFKQAVEDLQKEATYASYVSQNTINLIRTADEEPYRASDVVKAEVPDADQVEVDLVRKEDLGAVHEALVKEETVGLVVLGKTVNSSSQPSLIVLTTRKKLFVFDPKEKFVIKFLDIKLRDKNIDYWTTNGKNESDCLLYNYDININRRNHTDCWSVHREQMKIVYAYPKCAVRRYPVMINKKKETPRRLLCNTDPEYPLAELVEDWLNISRDEVLYDTKKIAHLESRPLDTTAVNIIKKRCLLVLPVVRILKFYRKLDANLISRHVFSTYLTGKDDKQVQLMLNKSRDKGLLDIHYWAHLIRGIRIEEVRNGLF